MTYKVKDVVVCIPGYSSSSSDENYGGVGYVDGEEFEIDRITFSEQGKHQILWRLDFSGIYAKAVRLKTKPLTKRIKIKFKN